MATAGGGLIKAATAVGALAPALLLLGAAGSKFELFQNAYGYEVVALRWAFWAAIVGVLVGGAALALSLRNGRTHLSWAVVALLLPSVVFAGVLRERMRLAATPDAYEASTDRVTPPSFSEVAERSRAGARNETDRGALAGEQDCAGARAIPRLLEPEEAAAALEAGDIQVTGRAPWRVEGVHETFWFGLRSDVVMRLEPGRSDVRVVSRDLARDGGLSCRILERIVTAVG